jgi:hypothetical protein
MLGKSFPLSPSSLFEFRFPDFSADEARCRIGRFSSRAHCCNSAPALGLKVGSRKMHRGLPARGSADEHHKRFQSSSQGSAEDQCLALDISDYSLVDLPSWSDHNYFAATQGLPASRGGHGSGGCAGRRKINAGGSSFVAWTASHASTGRGGVEFLSRKPLGAGPERDHCRAGSGRKRLYLRTSNRCGLPCGT